MTSIEERLDTLQARLDRIEDEQAVARVLSAYGPLVDSGSAEAVAALWAPDGVYDVDELMMSGRSEIEAMVRGSTHQSWITGGCAHVLGPPHITVSGDDATAVCYSLMLVHGDEGFDVRRVTANHFRLERVSSRWRITTRTSRVLDGRPESPELLVRGVRAAAAGSPEGAATADQGAAGVGEPAPDDRRGVIDSLHRLQRAIDSKDWAGIRAVFSDDGSGYGASDLDTTLATMRAHLGGVGPTQHLLGNEHVEVEGDEATSRAYARVHHVGAGPKEGAFVECLGEYEDRWVRSPDGWRLAHRTFAVHHWIGDRDVLRPA